MAYLITYSQTEKGKELFANTATEFTPAMWLLGMNKKYPETYTRLYFAIEISAEDFSAVDGEILKYKAQHTLTKRK